MNTNTTPHARSKHRVQSANRLLGLAALAFAAGLLSLLTACQLVEAAIAPLPTAAVSAAGEVEFILAGTPRALVGTPAGYIPSALGSPLDPTVTPTPSATPTETPTPTATATAAPDTVLGLSLIPI